MHPTTVSKIEAAERSVRITEAVGIAELFEMSLDNLLGSPDDSGMVFALTTLCRYAGDAERQIKRAQEVAADIGDQLELVEESFDLNGLDDLRQVAKQDGRVTADIAIDRHPLCHTGQRRDCGSCGPMRRKRRAGVEDLWTQSVRLADAPTRTVPTARAGRGMRWRARYVDAEGRERTKAFRRKIDAAQWLDGVTAQFATGTYVKPEAGQVTVAAVYASWSASQGHILRKTAATRRSAWTGHVEPPWGGVAVIDVKTAAVRAGCPAWSPMRLAHRQSRTHSGCCVRCSARRSRTHACPAIHATG